MPTSVAERRLQKALALGAALVLILGLGACDSGGGEDEGPAPGTFTATVSGDAEAEHAGEALYGVAVEDEPQPGEVPEYFQIAMIATNETDTALVSFVRQTAERLDEGTYDVIDGIEAERDGGRFPEDAIAGLFISRAAGGLFVSRSGTLEITRAEGGQLRGTFAFEADEVFIIGSDPGSRSVSVEGTFNARRVEELSLP